MNSFIPVNQAHKFPIAKKADIQLQCTFRCYHHWNFI